MGFGPLQRTAGQSAINLLKSGPFDLSRIFATGGATFERDVNRQAADLREGMGIYGNRAGTPLATGEALLRSGALQDWESLKARTALAARGQEADLIYKLNRMGLENIGPFQQALQLGVFPSETYFGPSPFSQATGAITGLAQGAGAIMSGVGLLGLPGAVGAAGAAGGGFTPTASQVFEGGSYVPTSLAASTGVGDPFWGQFGNRTQGMPGYLTYY